MYSTCPVCHLDLGRNDRLTAFPVGRRLAFDARRGRLWVICTGCGRWNLTPLEERWEAIEQAESLYRATRLRYSTDHIGLAWVGPGLELVRIGPALLPEIAAWRYGARLERAGASRRARRGWIAGTTHFAARTAASALVRYASGVGLSDDASLRMRTFMRERAVLARATDERGDAVTIRYAHLGDAELIRPDRDQPWRIRVAHDDGTAVLAQADGLRIAGKLLATLNFGVAAPAEVEHAISKLDHAGDPDGYFSRVASLAMRTSWGRHPDAPFAVVEVPERAATAEALALRLASRSFWAHGGTMSAPETPLFRLPAVDRLALEMAAAEDVERRALLGDLRELEAAWREADEIAAIADDLFADHLLAEFGRGYVARIRSDDRDE